MTKRRKIDDEKMLQMQEWITLPEAIRHLAMRYDGEIGYTHLLRFALDGKLKLSLYLTLARARPCLVISEDDIGKDELDCVDGHRILEGYPWREKGKFIKPEDNICLLDAHPYDLIMAGGVPNELREMLRKSSVLANPNQLLVSQREEFLGSPGVLVEDNNGKVFEIMTKSPISYELQNGELLGPDPGDYRPMMCLPHESPLVVRESELRRFVKLLTTEDSVEGNQQGQNEEKADLAKVLDKNHPWYSEPLAYAVRAWMELYSEREGDKDDNQFRPEEGNSKYIDKWLKKNVNEKIGETTRGHYRFVINPSKQGGPKKLPE